MATRPDRKAQLQLRSFLKNSQGDDAKLLKRSVALAFFNGLLMIAGTWLLAHALGAILFEDKTLAQLRTEIALMLFLLPLRAILLYLSDRLSTQAANRIRQRLGDEIAAKLTRLGPLWCEQKKRGELLNIQHNGIDALHNYFSAYLPAASFAALLPLAIFFVVLPADWKSGLILLVTAPLIPFFMILIGHKAEQLNQQRWQQLTQLGDYFLDRIQGLTQLRLFGAGKRELAHVAAVSDEFRHSTMGVLKIAFLSSLAMEFLATVSIAMVAVIVGFRLYWGTLDFSTGFLVLLLAPEFYLPLRQLAVNYHARMEGLSASVDIQAILTAQEDDSFSKTHCSEANGSKANYAETKSQVSQSTTSGLKLDKLNYTYPESAQGIYDINARFEPGKLYALIGPSGAGKSTLLDCILGFSGRFDTISLGEKALSECDLAQWRRHFAWVPQRPTLFHGSVRDNIALARPDASDEEIIAAAKKAHADEFIRSMKNGYSSLIGEQGEGLSGGQRQRLALARAFLSGTDILLLDEPSAHLDKHSEQAIEQAIYAYAKEHTVIMIAHRLHTIRHADCVLVMENGRLTGRGSFEELAADHPYLKSALSAVNLTREPVCE